MNPSIHITNRRTAEAVARTLRERNRAGAFLSIRGTDEETPDLSTPGGSSCYLCFDDVEDDSVPGCTPMSDAQATLVANFLAELTASDPATLIVHCSAGISRSAGVAAAIHDALRWPVANARDDNVFRDGKFAPNMHCYRTMLRALGGDVTQEELDALWQAAVESADET